MRTNRSGGGKQYRSDITPSHSKSKFEYLVQYKNERMLEMVGLIVTQSLQSSILKYLETTNPNTSSVMSLNIDFSSQISENDFLTFAIAGKSVERLGVILIQSQDYPGYKSSLMHICVGFYHIFGPFIETTEQLEILLKIVKQN